MPHQPRADRDLGDISWASTWILDDSCSVADDVHKRLLMTSTPFTMMRQRSSAAPSIARVCAWRIAYVTGSCRLLAA